jgi:hypothetical protein
MNIARQRKGDDLMTKRIDIMKRHISFFGVLAAMAIAPLAHADYAIAYSVNGDGPNKCLDNPDSTNSIPTSMTCSAVDGNVTISGAGGTSNSPGVPAGAIEFSSVATLTNNGSTAETVTLWYSAQGFKLPVTGGAVTGIDFDSSSGATGKLGNIDSSLALTSCVDEANALPAPYGPPTGFCVTPAQQIVNPLLDIPDRGAASNSVDKIFTPLTATYSLEQKLVVILGANDVINISTSQSLTPVPEPMSVALLGGVLLLTGRAIQRRRKQKNNISA